ncbi:MAG: sulfatase [Planctomycetaceae bacterium]|nr:sulfatase [Planctomycetaceae bacterium]
MTRRRFLNQFGMGMGGIALTQMLGSDTTLAAPHGTLQQLHHAPRAKRVIFLFQSGGPSQMDLFDYKPILNEKHGTELPEEVRMGQRLTAMSGNQASLPLAGSPFKFAQRGKSGIWMSDLLPKTAEIADEICVVKSMHTEAINHGPAVTFVQTGSQFPGRPSVGGWLSYGLGNESDDLPAFVVMVTKDKGGQPLVSRLWGSGFLPSKHQGVRFRSGKDPVLYLSNPSGLDRASRERMLGALNALHQLQLAGGSDPQIETRIAQHELAFRMQASIPEATDLSSEPEHVFKAYGEDARTPGTFAANCLQARRLAERGVRFIQLYHPGWDQHGGLPAGIKRQCQETDQASAALVQDLKQRGLLDDTLVIWGGEFGRTNYCQGKLAGHNFGRDHHPRCYTMWMAGGGIRGGMSYGETDPYGYNIAANAVHIHDLQATILHQLGIDHERLTFKYQGRHFRLTDVHGEVVRDIIS